MIFNPLCRTSRVPFQLYLLESSKKIFYNFCHSSCCAGRNSNVTTERLNSDYIITVFKNFRFDIPLSVGETNE